ncbi:EF_hand domain-containing protein [Hexamita inflata]|uniref:EF hand domain-containing protein n=1 Tax=Hexamita inflata TaxID=28002 RepID=A0AA86PIU5_9EUKA|nr:EF hand domain-containing protein [Hexamita inflata]CAI9959179.1 EF hand domain-containing protein [Hexamita inflata]
MGCGAPDDAREQDSPVRAPVRNKVKFVIPEREHVKKIFEKIDFDKSGTIDKQEVMGVICQLGVRVKESQVLRAFNLTDIDKKKCLNFDEFYHMFYVLSNTTEDQMMMIFLYSDLDCSGSIDPKELKRVFDKLGKNFSEGTIQKIVRKYNGTKPEVDYGTFLAILKDISQ